MAFALTLLYIALTLISPAVLPDAIINLHVMEILGGLVILSLLPSIPGARLGSTPETYIALGLLVSTAFSTLMTGWLGGVIQTISDFTPILFAFYFVAISCNSLRRLKILTVVLVAVAFFVFAQGGWAYNSGNFTSHYLESQTIGDTVLYRFRGLGIISDPNDLAQIFVMLIPLLWLRWKRGRSFSNFLFTIVPAGVLSAGIYFTHSRGAVVALMAVLLFGLKDKLGVVKSSIFAGGAMVGLMVLNITGGRGINEDDGGRVAAWITGLEVFRSHPLFGIGMGRFGEYNETGLTAHNSYVLCLAELSIVGYFFWMGMIVFGWSGLTKVIGWNKKEDQEIDSASQVYPYSAKVEPATEMKPLLRAPRVDLAGVRPGGNAAALSRYAYAADGNAVAVRTPYHLGGVEEDASTDVSLEDEDDLIYAAKVFRVAFVGLLTSSFFLSRTYSIALYVLLGMAVALKTIYRKKHPDLVVEVLPLVKRTWVVIFASIILLYLFVRVRGVH
jgi:O-antigen ligase